MSRSAATTGNPDDFVQRRTDILLRFERDDLVQFFLYQRRQFHKPGEH